MAEGTACFFLQAVPDLKIRDSLRKSKQSLVSVYALTALLTAAHSSSKKKITLAKRQSSPPKHDAPKTLVVGVGASAGGLEAFTDLLQNLPTDTGMAFVLVQHLDPGRESGLTGLLAKTTSLSVKEVTDKTHVEPNHIYVIPPNTYLTIEKGVLRLQPRPNAHGIHRSIDFFFESLAQDQQERAIGIVLSGTASDGTLGLEAIKAEGGITFAQDGSAKFESMPRSAVAAGVVDHIYSPELIARELDYIARHPFIAGADAQASPENDRASATQHETDDTPLPSGGHGSPPTKSAKVHGEAAGRPRPGDNAFKGILNLLHKHCGVDFSLYKSPTIQRRITRRMVLNRLTLLADYERALRDNIKELDALYSDVLISVTNFFRNPEAFEVLKRKIFPELLKQRGDDPVRVWVLGCSTGQEAYSLAMVFLEVVEGMPRPHKLQIFATDLHEALLEKARQGLYAKTLTEDISPERLRRFFTAEDGGYRVIKSVREQVVFARQNLITDPPFSRMDLVSCRNLLIYLEPSLQQKAMPMFHYALKPTGYLFLGSSESVSGFDNLFDQVDRKQKIFSRKAATTSAYHLLSKKTAGKRSLPQPPQLGPLLPIPRDNGAQGNRNELDSQREADRVLVNKFSPPAVLVNADLQILQFRGATGDYLEPPKGKASFDVLKMARDGLLLPLRATINKAKKDNKPVRKENVPFRRHGENHKVSLEVIPLTNLRERCFLILFENAADGASSVAGFQSDNEANRPQPTKSEAARHLAAVERELAETRDYVQSIQEQGEAANEELQSSNEEVQSSNEELQSINEELETSKEELESTNEELITVNEEMTNRNVELSQIYNDLNNLQISTPVGIVLLSRDLVIRRFNPRSEKFFSLQVSDIGRPIRYIRHSLDMIDLDAFAIEVIQTLRESIREVRDKDGRYYSLRARPYVTQDNKVDGVVLVIVDIDAEKVGERILFDRESEFRALADHMSQLAWMTDKDGAIYWFNMRWFEYTGTTLEDVKGWGWQKMHHPDHVDRVVVKFKKAFETGEIWEDTFPLRGKDGTYRWFLSRALPVRDANEQIIRWIGTNTDITERREAEEQRSVLVNELNHRVKNTLATVQSMASQTMRSSPNMAEAKSRFEDRLMSLSKAHDVLTREKWESAPLADIVERAIMPYGGSAGELFEVSGPDTRISAQMALAFAMTLHELCTNAVKYGALSKPKGRVEIGWRVSKVKKANSILKFHWREKGGPPVAKPASRGFGTRLIERNLANDLGGNVKITFARSGVKCEITTALENGIK